MDPLAVLRTIWRLKWFAVPAIVITIAAASLVYAFGPREYESTISYALVNPTIPTEAEIEADPALGELNSDNPYLRSSDPNLIANVVITRLNAPATADSLEAQGLSTDYVASPGVGGAGLIVSITATGSTQSQSLDTVQALGSLVEMNLRQIQTVRGADDQYLFTSIIVAEPDRATEKLSSRLRTVIVVVVGGVILIFGAISLGTWIEGARRRREEAEVDAVRSDADDDEPAPRSAGSTPRISAPRPARPASTGADPVARGAQRGQPAKGSSRTSRKRGGVSGSGGSRAR